MEKISVKEIEWKVVISFLIKIYIVSFLSIIVTVTTYKILISSEYFDKSEVTQIKIFLTNILNWILPFLQIILTFLFSFNLYSYMDKGYPLHGFLIGVFVGIANISINLIVIHKFYFSHFLLLLALVASGFIGGLFEEKHTQKTKKIALLGNKKIYNVASK